MRVIKPDLIARSIRFWWQRRRRGWDDSDTWSLDLTIAYLVLPRLERFKEVNCGFPGGLGSTEEWNAILDKMIYSFRHIIEEQACCFHNDGPCPAEEGLDLFRRWYFHLWW